jgi:hypothetical protein
MAESWRQPARRLTPLRNIHTVNQDAGVTVLPGARHRRMSSSRSVVPTTEEAVGGGDRLGGAVQAV